jgi:uroporphyrinogen-III synthase
MAYAVITREAEAAAVYAAVLAPMGLEGVAMPVTCTAPPRDPGELERAIARGGQVAIVVASMRAASALASARGSAGLAEVWAVGPATARVLAEAGIPAVVPVDVRDGATLARALVEARAISGRRVLVPRAEEGREEAIAILREAGAEVEAVAAYRTVAAAADDPALAEGLGLLRRGAAAVCAVFAPSQVAALDALVGVRAITARFAAIGETTATALRAAGATAVAVAGAPTPEGLAKAVSAVYPQES